MPTVRADQSRGGAPRAALAVLVAVVLGASGCTGVAEPVASPDTTSPPNLTQTADGTSGTGKVRGEAPAVEGLPVPPDLDAAFSALLDTRARALVQRDRAAFVSVLDRGNPGFVTAQEGYFDNLAQLPLATFAYTVDRSSLVRGRASYSVVVEIAMQLEGFDATATRTLDRFRFDRVGKGNQQGYRLASVTDRAWEESNDIRPQPWEVRPVQVRLGTGVLAVFDDTSVAAADPLLRSLETSIADVSGRVPYPWDPAVVVYALSDTAFIRSLDDLPGDDPDALDAIAFTVPAGPGDPRAAATRIALNPRIIARSDLALERLLRHEITHVAVGERDDNAPVWLAEGIAEWVSVQALPERTRRIGTEALTAARKGVDSMPDDATFNDDTATSNYATSWWVCEYLATTFGETAPWVVLDAFAAPDTPESPTIQALLQISVDKLAKRGNELLVSNYAPGSSDAQTKSPPKSPTGTPGDKPGRG